MSSRSKLRAWRRPRTSGPPRRSSQRSSGCARPSTPRTNAVELRQRERGKLLARERLEKLLDPAASSRLDRYVRHRNPHFGMMEKRPWGDAVLATGYAAIFGHRVFVFSQDFTVFGGTLSEAFAEKVCKVMDLALKLGCPLIGINDSGGARVQEDVVSLGGYAEIFWRNVQASGVLPQISLVMGPCAGGAVYSPAMTDFVLMVKETSYMFITGPEVVKTVTGEEVTFEETGGALTASKSGVAHFATEGRGEHLEDARYLLSFLPQNNVDPPPYFAPADPPDREDIELDALIPGQADEAVRHARRDRARRGRRRVPRGAPALGREHRRRLRAPSAATGGDRRQQPEGARGHARHRLLREGRALRPHVRRVQPPARHLRGRPGLPAGGRRRGGAGSSATARSSCTPTRRRPCRRSR